jgi:hypothetical protein
LPSEALEKYQRVVLLCPKGSSSMKDFWCWKGMPCIWEVFLQAQMLQKDMLSFLSGIKRSSISSAAGLVFCHKVVKNSPVAAAAGGGGGKGRRRRAAGLSIGSQHPVYNC